MRKRWSSSRIVAAIAVWLALVPAVCAQTDSGSARAIEALETPKAVAQRLSEIQRKFAASDGVDAAEIAELQALADAGYPRAAFLAGETYRLGIGTLPDHARAISYFERALEAGERGAAERLAMIYKDAGSDSHDPAKSVEYYQIAAADGSRSARLALADAYAAGFGTEVDAAEADALYARLMDEGDARAAVRLGTLRLSLDNTAGAAEAWRFAADAGRTEVLMRLGRLLRDRLESGPEARQVFLLAAAAQIAGAEDALLRGDLDGAFGPASDGARAAVWLENEADLRATLATARKLRDGGSVTVTGISVLRGLMRHQSQGSTDAADMLHSLYARNTFALDPEADDALKNAVAAVAQDAEMPAAERRKLAISAQRRGHYDIAVQALETAAKAGDGAARTQLALWHLRGQIGLLSDPGLGLSLLPSDAGQMDAESAVLLASAFTDPTVRGATDVSTLLSVLDRTAREGSSTAALLHLRVLRLANVTDAARLSEAFLRSLPDEMATDDVMLEYLILRGANARSERAWREVAVQGAELPGAQFARLLSTLRGANANVLIYTLQKRLENEGYKTPVNGYLTPATVRAILEFCQRNGVLASCKKGPLRASGIRAISTVFAKEP
ncbi:tetratricopeptide repeat protein [Pseudotabrizicola algicola]|uniref:Sel1 repeat family protein n=1 Tax=Pseudotabrizicola algicola TaxID=2709381 RepID=A0A6B3RP49_9RHOB|nr:tetratricopeptide repeat protein [Pseudotabrizicola algicola]NEX45865.1 sel1 repeat family protein [Pseudotabrizicola algicola]